MSIEDCYEQELNSFQDLGSIEACLQFEILQNNQQTGLDTQFDRQLQSGILNDNSIISSFDFPNSSDKEEEEKFKQSTADDVKIDCNETKIKDDEIEMDSQKIQDKKEQKYSLVTDQTIQTGDEINKYPQTNKKKINRRLNSEVCLQAQQLIKEGMSFKSIANKLGLSQRSINKIQTQYQLYGRLIPENGASCNARLILEKQKQFQASQEIIKSVITKDCSITLKDMQRALRQKGISKSRSTIHAYLARMKISRKKLQKIPLQRNSNSKIEYRKSYCKMIQQIPLSKQVFMDETIFGLQTTGHYGWAPKGQQPKTYLPASRRKHITLLAAVSMRGFQATRLVKGPVTSRHICQFLQHYLDHLQEDQVLVMDNARMHHAGIVKEKIKELNRQVRYIPAYTPQLNPIENIFSEIKVNYIKLKKDSDIKGQDMLRLIEEAIKNMRSKEFSKYYGHYWQWLQKGAAGELFL